MYAYLKYICLDITIYHSVRKVTEDENTKILKYMSLNKLYPNVNVKAKNKYESTPLMMCKSSLLNLFCEMV